MSGTISSIWNKLSSFAQKLGNSEKFIQKAKLDYSKVLDQYNEKRRFISRNFNPAKLNSSLLLQNFYPWRESLACFYLLIFSGFRHTALREVRYYIETSARSYFIDWKYPEKTYEEKVKKLHKVRFNKFKELVQSLPVEKRVEINDFYGDLCNYVHLSEITQTDALRDFELGLILGHPEYEEDKEMLAKAVTYSCYMLSQIFKE